MKQTLEVSAFEYFELTSWGSMNQTDAKKSQRNPNLFAEKEVGQWHDLPFNFALFTIQRATLTWKLAGASLFPVTVAEKVAKKLEVPDS